MTSTRVGVARRPMEHAAAASLLEAAHAWVGELSAAGRLPDAWSGNADQPVDRSSDCGDRLVAWVGPVPAGLVVLRWHDDAADIRCLWVRPVARHRGVAHVLLGATIAHAAEHGIRVVRLAIDPVEMADAVAVARRFGFVDDAGEGPVLTMQRVIDDAPRVR